MRLTARNLVISLLILAQGILLWQGAAGLISLNAVDTENQVHCHQTPLSDHNIIQTHITNDRQDHCNKGCVGFCDCNHCACSIALVSSYFINRVYRSVLNDTAFPSFSEPPFTQLIKPPRKFRS